MHILILVVAAAAFLFILDHFNLSTRILALETKLASLVTDAKVDVEAVSEAVKNAAEKVAAKL